MYGWPGVFRKSCHFRPPAFWPNTQSFRPISRAVEDWKKPLPSPPTEAIHGYCARLDAVEAVAGTGGVGRVAVVATFVDRVACAAPERLGAHWCEATAGTITRTSFRSGTAMLLHQ